MANGDDGRVPLADLLSSADGLRSRHNWTRELVAEQFDPLSTSGTPPFPIYSYLSPARAAASPNDLVFVIGGIHGEEPAGPMALSQSLDALTSLATLCQVVVLLMCNPVGYAGHRRYPDGANSVGDSGWLLRPEDPEPVLSEARALQSYVLRVAIRHRVVMSLDLHEDCLETVVSARNSYVYSQGALGERDRAAALVVKTLGECGLPPLESGVTRFGEKIVNGIVGPTQDGSIDELLSAESVLTPENRTVRVPGPKAGTVLVVETPGVALLEERVRAHKGVLAKLPEMYGMLVKQL